MLISHKHKFITIDIPKTGTASYKDALRPYVDIIGAQKHEVGESSPFYQHENSEDAKLKFSQLGFDWSQYFKYVTIRNPWARFASYYMWVKNKFDLEDSKTTQSIGLQMFFKRWKKIFDMCEYDQHKVLKHIIKANRSQYYYFVSNNIVLVDYIAKTEEIDQHFSFLCTKAGITPPPKLQHKHKSAFYNYKDLYNQEMIDMVAEKEKYILKNYNYQF